MELRHVTAATRGGLCRLSASPANPFQRTVHFVCSDDIFMTSPGTPLVEQHGAESLAKMRQRFVWNGDRNSYQDIDVFWAARGADSEAAPNAMSFEDWITYWGASRENQPSREPLAWRHAPNASRPLHEQSAADYTLEDPTFGDAAFGAPGFRFDRALPHPYEASWGIPPPAPGTAPRGDASGERLGVADANPPILEGD